MKRKTLLGIFSLVGALIVGLVLVVGGASAQPVNPAPPVQPQPPGVDNETCLSCHGQPDQYTTLPSGEPLYLTVDRDEYNDSVHGKKGYACVQCHTEYREYPHPPLAANTRRDVNLEMYTSCAHCHESMFDATLDSTHQKALASGNEDAAVCTDCHGAHNTQPPDEPPSRKAQMCEKCHSQIYNQYRVSVHGEALIGEGNPDVPSCTDCHGVHDVQGPSGTESDFHLSSPLICAECHADEELMNEYGISTDVFDTYVNDFHGTTVMMFEANTPGQETNKPVCIDCHGVHDIRSSADPKSHVMQANLLTTCQRCHPDATDNFPSSWLGHYIPDQDKFPIVYFVDLFYTILIPAVLGFMILFVAGDAARRLINWRKERAHGQS